ncbi:unnamed protein product [Mytilus coruscus]|uniref:Endonuclease/exonuclease/phosphatase domain-containing protein n=1 Tax=Mytilus coruscus TaxID=42192 RepID=A0A6J8CN87_MYTCO|nr:unnamed protein product [Mytilus coruscus]
MMTGSEPQYREHLDKISSIIDKNNNHDKLLKEFCRKYQLNHTLENTQGSTFYHHNGKSCSQIDYILENKDTDILRSTAIEDQYHINGSAHVPIRAKTNMAIASDKIKGKKSKPKIILKWEETNIGSYQKAIETRQEQSNNPDLIADIEEQAFNIIDILSKASNTSVKKKIVSLKGPNWKASEKVIRAYIKKAQSDSSTTLIIKNTNGEDIVEQEKQTDIFAEFYETLATTATEEHFDSEYMEECEFRYNLINSIVHQSTINENDITQFTEEEIKKSHQ